MTGPRKWLLAEALPCFSCGSEDLTLRIVAKASAIRCTSCGANGPNTRKDNKPADDHQALLMWNELAKRSGGEKMPQSCEKCGHTWRNDKPNQTTRCPWCELSAMNKVKKRDRDQLAYMRGWREGMLRGLEYDEAVQKRCTNRTVEDLSSFYLRQCEVYEKRIDGLLDCIFEQKR